MKNLFVSLSTKAIALLILLLSVSCNDDKEPVAPAGPNTEFNAQKYTISNGFIQNGGSVDFFLDDEAEEKSHFNYNFILTDGTPTFEGGNVVSLNDGKIVISAVLLSPGTIDFKSGVFAFDDWSACLELDEEEIQQRYQEKYFFPLAYVFTDKDGDKNWTEEVADVVTGGTIKVTGTAPNYSTEYDLTLAGGKTLKGKFSGKFNIVQD